MENSQDFTGKFKVDHECSYVRNQKKIVPYSYHRMVDK